MTILQGTMQDGTVIPVQVDAQGRLVAEGLQGPPGPAGPTGPVGPEGPPIALPPNPKDGDVLGWANGGLAWLVPAQKAPDLFAYTDLITAVGTAPGTEYWHGLSGDIAGNIQATGLFNGTCGGIMANNNNTSFSWTVPQQHNFMDVRVEFSALVGSDGYCYVNGQQMHVRGVGNLYCTVDTVVSGRFSGFSVQAANSRGAEMGGFRVGGACLKEKGSGTLLTFASDRGLSDFKPGDAVHLGGSPSVTATVRSVDVANSQITLDTIASGFVVGGRVVGPWLESTGFLRLEPGSR